MKESIKILVQLEFEYISLDNNHTNKFDYSDSPNIIVKYEKNTKS